MKNQENRDEIIQKVKEYIDNEKQDTIFIPGVSSINASGAQIETEDLLAVIDTALDGWFTEWKQCARFANALKKYVEKPHCVLTNSGSSASLVAMSTMCEHYKGKFVITTALAFPTTVAPIYQNNRIPIYIDVNRNTFQPDMDQFREVMKDYGEDIAGAIFTHTLGLPYDEIEVSSVLCTNQFLISDVCDALGAKISSTDDKAGSFSSASTYSFFPAHHITSGEGGAVTFWDEEYYETARSFVSWGKKCFCSPGQDNACGKRFQHKNQGTLPDGYDHKYVFGRLGYNLKMTEPQGALGYSQLQRIDENVLHRQRNYLLLTMGLYGTPYIGWVAQSDNASPFGFPITIAEDAPFTANEMIAYLESKKIRTRRLFAGNITRQPGYNNLPYIKKDLTSTDYLMNNAFWIGCHPGLDENMIGYMIENIKEFIIKKG